MNPNNAERPAPLVVHPAGVPVGKRLPSTLGAKRDVSQPAHETCAPQRAASQSSPVIKAGNACAQDRGVEVILANHGCSRSAPAPHTPDAVSPADEVHCNRWELFALLSFIVLSYAGLFFCTYVILAKCRGTWPFQH